MFFKKSNRKYGTNFIPPTNTLPPEDPPNQYGSAGSIDNSELDILLHTTPPYEEWEKRFAIFKKDTSQYSVVTKDEYILSFIKRFGGDKERAIESFNKISEGYNFIFTIGDNQYYSVDYINKLLER